MELLKEIILTLKNANSFFSSPIIMISGLKEQEGFPMIIQSKKVWIADQFFAAAIEVENEKIIGVLPYGSKPADVDYGDKRIVPGFLDIHCHGAFEFDTNDAQEEGLRNWTKHIVSKE